MPRRPSSVFGGHNKRIDPVLDSLPATLLGDGRTRYATTIDRMPQPARPSRA
jgi:hypothetical protein